MWKLCQDVATRHPSELPFCAVTFISNHNRRVPLWRQREGRDEDKVIVWVSNNNSTPRIFYFYYYDCNCLINL